MIANTGKKSRTNKHRKNNLRKIKRSFIFALTVILTGLLLPEKPVIPVRGASDSDWNHNTFWHEPWGESGVHKGIDIFAKKGTSLISSTYGVVLYSGSLGNGGNVVAILGPKWRIHYYAHLDSISVGTMYFIRTGEEIGTVGDSGNARGKPAHVHYSIVTIIPHFLRWDSSTQGWKKIFYLDPGNFLLTCKMNGKTNR